MEKSKKTLVSTEVKIGVVVVLALAMLYFGLNYLKGVNIFTPNSRYYVQYERIDGIVKTTHVLVNGYQVGHVSEIYFDYTKEAPITLELTLDRDLVVPEGTVAEVYDTGLMGDKAIQLRLGSGPDQMTPGDTLTPAVSGGMMAQIVDAIMPPIKSIMPKLDSTVTELNRILADPNIKKILSNTEQATAKLNSSSAKLDRMMDKDVPEIVAKINSVSGKLDAICSDLENAELDSTLIKVNEVVADLQHVSNKLKSSDNTVGALINDSTLYKNIDATIVSANELLIDLKANPKRYVHFSVFGSKDKKDKNKDKNAKTKTENSADAANSGTAAAE